MLLQSNIILLQGSIIEVMLGNKLKKKGLTMVHHKIFDTDQLILYLFFHKSIEEAFPIPSHPFIELSEVDSE